jgi:hypothetical protein
MRTAASLVHGAGALVDQAADRLEFLQAEACHDR